MTNTMLHRLHVASLVATVVLCTSSLAVNALHLSSDIEDARVERIVGGQEADIGEYPYFVSTRGSGCGGVLVASEYVLTAVHCGDITGQEVIVGAYNRGTTENGGIKRRCVDFWRDPNFVYQGSDINRPGAPFVYDAALCKLDTPIYVSEDEVKFELNSDLSYPSPNSDVVAVGFGTTSSGGSQPPIIRDVVVQVDTNSACAAAPSSIYNSGTITAPIICASVDGGGKDACQGDSGGPLVKRTTVGGKRVDYHVGLTSWGIGCASKDFPGVYSRTAYSYNFIRRIICNDGDSPHAFCESSTTNCSSNQEKLVIKLVTDSYPDEIGWTLSTDGNSISAKDDFQKKYFPYETTICLNKGTDYDFEIVDGYGDGLTAGEKGFYALIKDGTEIRRAFDYGFSDGVKIRTETPPSKAPTKRPTKRPTKSPTKRPTSQPESLTGLSVSCTDDLDYRFKDKNCDGIFEDLRKRKRDKKCEKLDPGSKPNGKTIRKFCPSYCRKKCRQEKKALGRN